MSPLRLPSLAPMGDGRLRSRVFKAAVSSRMIERLMPTCACRASPYWCSLYDIVRIMRSTRRQTVVYKATSEIYGDERR